MRAMRGTVTSIAVIVAWALWAAPAAAGFRCDTDLVDRGMTPFEVRERCGAPEHEIGHLPARDLDRLFRFPAVLVRPAGGVTELTVD